MRPMYYSEVRLSEFSAYVNAEIVAGNRNGQRVGQHLMNCLARYDRELYLQITGKPEDPFYNDDKIEAFTAYCLNYWAQFGPETEQQRLI